MQSTPLFLKRFITGLALSFWSLFPLSATQEREISPRGKQLIAHVLDSIKHAEVGSSSLPVDILELEGMSSPRVRRFLNHLCSLEAASYLEIGCWKGSTLVSALYGNDQLEQAIAIDNWSEFGGPQQEFIENVYKYISQAPLDFYETDCFCIDKAQVFKQPINIYFYDGDHSFEAQKKAFTFFNSILDHTFIAIVDDWNNERIQQGTLAGFKELGYRVLFQVPLFSPANQTVDGWWNGLYVAVIEKNSFP